MSDDEPTIEVRVQKRLRLDNLLPLDAHEQELAEKRQALFYEFSARLCELELSLLQLMQPDRPPLR